MHLPRPREIQNPVHIGATVEQDTVDRLDRSRPADQSRAEAIRLAIEHYLKGDTHIIQELADAREEIKHLEAEKQRLEQELADARSSDDEEDGRWVWERDGKGGWQKGERLE